MRAAVVGLMTQNRATLIDQAIWTTNDIFEEAEMAKTGLETIYF